MLQITNLATLKIGLYVYIFVDTHTMYTSNPRYHQGIHIYIYIYVCIYFLGGNLGNETACS